MDEGSMDDDLSSNISWKLTEESEIANKIWSYDETKTFLQLYEKLISNGSYSRKKYFWIDCATSMRKKNFAVTARQCENKWKGLMRSYRFGRRHAFTDMIKDLIALDPLENNDTPKWEFDKSAVNDREKLCRFSLQEHDYFPNGIIYSKTWSRYETERLIEHYKKLHLSANVPKVKKDMWDKLSASLQLEKINVTGSQCENKWKGLLKSYKNSRRSTKFIGKARLYEKLEDAISSSENAIQKNGLPFKKSENQKIIIAEFEDRDDDDEDDEENDENDDDDDEYDEIITKMIAPISETRKFYFCDGQTNKEEIVETSQSAKIIETPESSFETKFLDYLHQKENARQKRHEENLEIKKRKLNLMEQLVKQQLK